MKPFAEIDIENNGKYLKLLSAVSKLSALFSESAIPYINYRVAENIFCESFNATNLSRSDTAFDAVYNSLGIGLKTFTTSNRKSREKIAEFNSLSNELRDYQGIKLARKLAEFRNDRIELAKRLYNINKSVYHIVARSEKKLSLFETNYDTININNIKLEKKTRAGIFFEDGINLYSYNYSKSTLFRVFETPTNAYEKEIEIIDDPFSLLLNLFEDVKTTASKNHLIKGYNYIILPLYSTRNNPKKVPSKSGLNQWNANGRKRNFGEIYIPIPAKIHNYYPNFFPKRDTQFKLQIPTGEIFDAKVCQENSKALMTNPNKALSDWLLRKVLHLKEGELATIKKLNELGIDSVIITKNPKEKFKIDVMKTNSYTDFWGNNSNLL